MDEMLIDRFSYIRTLELNSALPDDRKLPMPKVRPEYFCAGSARDNASHFLLRLASAVAEPNGGAALERTVARGETLMWRGRVADAPPTSLRTLHAAFLAEAGNEAARVRGKLRGFHELDRVGELRDRYLRFLTDLCALLKETQGWHKDHAIRYNKHLHCDLHIVKVPWRLVKSLVRGKRVCMAGGRVELRCSQLVSVLEEAFRENLRLSTAMLRCLTEPGACNPQLVELANKMAVLCADQPETLAVTGLKASEVDEESRCFPPCMKWAFDRLKQEHNCHHNTRYQLTLFLKSLGMSAEQQLSFWREEYSKPAPTLGGKAKWVERRYAYSIRHAYGLEGKRVAQDGWTCARIQSESASAPGPVCPFLLPAPAMTERLPPTLSPDDVASVVETAAAGRPNAACNACLAKSKGCDLSMTKGVTLPVHYYLKHRDLMEW